MRPAAKPRAISAQVSTQLSVQLTAQSSVLPANQLVTFTQQSLPGLIDGEYKLSIRQRVEDPDKATVSTAPIDANYTFAVLGDRFSFNDPSGTVYATFPDNAASGEFSTVLAHVVFTTPTLPWARTPLQSRTLPAPGVDADGDVPSWLAVLVLDANDTPKGEPAITMADATIRDLFPPAIAPGSTLGEHLSYFRNASDSSDLEPGQTLETSIKVLDLPLPLFQSIAPTLDDLALLSHVREVSLVNKPTMAGISDIGEPNGTFSIVIGNRLPDTNITSTAYLVSLEGLADLLPTDPPRALIPADQAKKLRLAVLHSWSFTSTGTTATFVDTLLALNGRAPDSKADAPYTSLRLPVQTKDPVVDNALGLGYVPLDHDLRDADKTVSWYRGPLAPVTVPHGRVNLPVASADQALILDPVTGLLDTSYAAAWTIGRLMAIQNQSFSVALYEWKRGLSRQVIDGAEEQVLNASPALSTIAASGLYTPGPGPRPALTQAQSAPLADALHRAMLLGLSTEPFAK